MKIVYLSIVIVVGIILFFALTKDEGQSGITPEAEPQQIPEATPQQVPEATSPPVPEATPQHAPEAVEQPVPEAASQPGLFRKIITLPYKIIKWPIVQLKNGLSRFKFWSDKEYRFRYHYFCEDRPDKFSELCSNKLPPLGSGGGGK